MTDEAWMKVIGTVLMDLPDSMTIAEFKELQAMIMTVTKRQGGYQQSWCGPTFMLFHMTYEESGMLKDMIIERFGSEALDDWDYTYDDDFPDEED